MYSRECECLCRDLSSYRLSTYDRRALLWLARRSGTLSRTISGIQKLLQTTSSSCWKRYRSQHTSAISALDVSRRYALQIYILLTYLLTYLQSVRCTARCIAAAVCPDSAVCVCVNTYCTVWWQRRLSVWTGATAGSHHDWQTDHQQLSGNHDTVRQSLSLSLSLSLCLSTCIAVPVANTPLAYVCKCAGDYSAEERFMGLDSSLKVVYLIHSLISEGLFNPANSNQWHEQGQCFVGQGHRSNVNAKNTKWKMLLMDTLKCE